MIRIHWWWQTDYTNSIELIETPPPPPPQPPPTTITENGIYFYFSLIKVLRKHADAHNVPNEHAINSMRCISSHLVHITCTICAAGMENKLVHHMNALCRVRNLRASVFSLLFDGRCLLEKYQINQNVYIWYVRFDSFCFVVLCSVCWRS